MEAWGRGYILDAKQGSHETFVSLRDMKYTDEKVVSLGRSLWLGMYKDIARANELIQSCNEKDDDFFTYGTVEKNVIMGEAIAIRAMLHFDLLRIFGQTLATEEGRNASYIPYVTEYPSKFNPPMKSSEVIGKIKEELSDAADYLATYDTLSASNKTNVLNSSIRFSSSNKPEWGRFYSQRGARLNYYAIRLLQARVALYNSDYEDAIKYGTELKKRVDEKSLALAVNSTLSSSPKMMSETLFAFYYDKLIDATENWFDRTNSMVLKIEDYANFTKISQDKRSNLLSNSILTVYNEDKNGTDSRCYVPSLRLGELYYILAEAMANNDDLPGAVALFNTFLKARGVTTASNQIPADVTLEGFYEYLYNDVRKEFAGLGQNVFFFKRLNVPVRYSGGNAADTQGNLLLPVPDTESAV